MTSCEAVKAVDGGDQQVAPNSLAALDAGWSAGSAPGQIPKLTLRRLSETVLLATSLNTIFGSALSVLRIKYEVRYSKFLFAMHVVLIDKMSY